MKKGSTEGREGSLGEREGGGSAPYPRTSLWTPRKRSRAQEQRKATTAPYATGPCWWDQWMDGWKAR